MDASGHGGHLAKLLGSAPFAEWVIVKVGVLYPLVATLGHRVNRGENEFAVISLQVPVFL